MDSESDDSDDEYRVRGGKSRRSREDAKKRRDRKKSKEKKRERRIFQHRTKELEEESDDEDGSDEEGQQERKSRSRKKKDKRGPITVQVTLPKGASRGLTVFLDFGSVMSMYPIPPMRYESNEVISIVVERPKSMSRSKPKITFAVPKAVTRTPREFYD